MKAIKFLESKGFSNVLWQSGGSIQIAANHISGVGVWFYSKHDEARLSIYDTHWQWWEEEIEDIKASDTHSFWDWQSEDTEEIDYFHRDLSDYMGGDMGGLLDDDRLISEFASMWTEYLVSIGFSHSNTSLNPLVWLTD